MVVALRLGLVHQSRALEEVRPDARADDRLRVVEQDLVRVDRVSEPLSSEPRQQWLTSMYFPNRDELSLRVVLAFPKASMIGFVARICSSVSLMPLAVVCRSSNQLPSRRSADVNPTLRRPGREGSSTVAK